MTKRISTKNTPLLVACFFAIAVYSIAQADDLNQENQSQVTQSNISQKSDQVSQTSAKGHNFNNASGDVTININAETQARKIPKTSPDPQKEYWWLIFVALPITLALIALVPYFLKKKPSQTETPSPTNGTQQGKQHAGKVEQTSGSGHNINNVQGNISITNTTKDDQNKS